MLGTNNATSYSSPVAISGNRSFDEIACGASHTLARIASTGLVYAWGTNTSGQLGDNTRTHKSSPVAVAGNRSFDAIYAGLNYSMAWDASTGLLWTWGHNSSGQLGTRNKTSYSSPVAVSGNRSFAFIYSMAAPPPSVGNIKKWSGALWANVKKIYGVPVANIKKVTGVAGQ
jgi:alpha-tubulin suppressor-like RCC1 family protein